jgi:hypothetical protein
MRIVEFLQPVLPQTERLIEQAGPLDLSSYLRIPGGPTVERRESADDGAFPHGSITLVQVNPEEAGGVHATLAAAESGALVALLFPAVHSDLPWPTVLGALSQASCQLLRVGPLSYQHLRTGLLVLRTDSVKFPLHTPFELSGALQDADFAAMLRLANEYVVCQMQLGSALAAERANSAGGEAADALSAQRAAGEAGDAPAPPRPCSSGSASSRP